MRDRRGRESERRGGAVAEARGRGCVYERVSESKQGRKRQRERGRRAGGLGVVEEEEEEEEGLLTGGESEGESGGESVRPEDQRCAG